MADQSGKLDHAANAEMLLDGLEGRVGDTPGLQHLADINVCGLLRAVVEGGDTTVPDRFDDRRREPGLLCHRRVDQPFVETQPLAGYQQDDHLPDIGRKRSLEAQIFADVLHPLRKVRMVQPQTHQPGRMPPRPADHGLGDLALVIIHAGQNLYGDFAVKRD